MGLKCSAGIRNAAVLICMLGAAEGVRAPRQRRGGAQAVIAREAVRERAAASSVRRATQWMAADRVARVALQATASARGAGSSGSSASAAGARLGGKRGAAPGVAPLSAGLRSAASFRLASARTLEQTESVATVVGGAVAEAVRAQEDSHALSVFVSLAQVQYWLVALTVLMMLTLTAVVLLAVLLVVTNEMNGAASSGARSSSATRRRASEAAEAGRERDAAASPVVTASFLPQENR